MENRKFRGVVTQVFDARTGDGKKGPWASRQFIVEEENVEYPNKMLFTRFKSGDYVDYALEKFNIKEGDRVSVEYTATVRFFNDYPNQNMMEFRTHLSERPQRKAKTQEQEEEDDMPF